MIINVKNLSFAYKGCDTILEGLDFSLDKSEILCVCGENGTGKSSLLCLLAGILEPSKGEIVSQDISLGKLSALIFQNPDMQLLGQSVLEEMLMIYPNIDEEKISEALKLLEDFGLSEKKESPIENLSFGQKRKLALASSLMQKPSLLLYDEPSAHLDYPSLLQLRKCILENKERNIAQCIVAHDVEIYADIADKILLLHKGKQVFYGSVPAAFDYIEEHKEIAIRLPSYWQNQDKNLRKILPW